MAYVDGFLIPVQKKNIQKYLRVARKAGKIFRRAGALEYRECVGDDLHFKDNSMGQGFPRLMKLKPGETAVFSWVVYKSKAARNAANKRIMKDPEMAALMQDPEGMAFDVKKMCYGGFKVGVDL